MKKALLIILLLVALPIAGTLLLVGTCAGGIWLAFSHVTEPGSALVRLAGAQKFHEAYALGTAELRAREDEAAFTKELKELELDRARSVSWNHFNVVNSDATIAGTVKLGDGRERPLTIQLIKEAGAWKIKSVQGEAPPSSDEKQL
jgi:hypothetical protein